MCKYRHHYILYQKLYFIVTVKATEIPNTNLLYSNYRKTKLKELADTTIWYMVHPPIWYMVHSPYFTYELWMCLTFTFMDITVIPINVVSIIVIFCRAPSLSESIRQTMVVCCTIVLKWEDTFVSFLCDATWKYNVCTSFNSWIRVKFVKSYFFLLLNVSWSFLQRKYSIQ